MEHWHNLNTIRMPENDAQSGLTAAHLQQETLGRFNQSPGNVLTLNSTGRPFKGKNSCTCGF